MFSKFLSHEFYAHMPFLSTLYCSSGWPLSSTACCSLSATPQDISNFGLCLPFYLNNCSLDIVNFLDILNCLSATPQDISNFGLRLLSKQLMTAPLRLQTELLQWLGSVYIVQVLFSLYLYCHLSIFKDKTTGNHDTSTFN